MKDFQELLIEKPLKKFPQVSRRKQKAILKDFMKSSHKEIHEAFLNKYLRVVEGIFRRYSGRIPGVIYEEIQAKFSGIFFCVNSGRK